MALNDNAVLTAAVGYVYTASVGTVAPTPTALKTLNLETTSGWTPATWKLLGHTSRNDMPEFGFDGGDSEVKGTWQRKKLREVTTEEPVDYLTLFLNQFDDDALGLYYGTNAVSTKGLFSVSGAGNAVVEKALFVVIEDGSFRIGFHASKASIKRDDAIQLPVDDLASLPIKATFLQHSTNPLFTWIQDDLFNQP